MSSNDPGRYGRQRSDRDDRPAASLTARPATPIVAVIIAAVAGLLGLVILRNVNKSGGGASARPTVPDTVVDTTPLTEPPTSAPTVSRTGATVLVANGSGVKGAAGSLTTQLQARGYTTVKAVNANSGTMLDITAVYAAPNDAAALAVAKSVIAEMGLAIEALPLDESVPIKQADLNGATVLIVLGKDKANQNLLPLGGGDAGGTPMDSTPPAVTEGPTTTSKDVISN